MSNIRGMLTNNLILLLHQSCSAFLKTKSMSLHLSPHKIISVRLGLTEFRLSIQAKCLTSAVIFFFSFSAGMQLHCMCKSLGGLVQGVSEKTKPFVQRQIYTIQYYVGKQWEME